MSLEFVNIAPMVREMEMCMEKNRKLLLITGDIAAGKSTFANILSQRYNTNVFFKDSIKEVLGDTIGFSNREENKKLSNASMELMFFIFSEFAKLGKGLILESNFHRAELERLQKMAQDNGYDVLTIALFGDVEVLHARYLNRMMNENRHSVHLSTTIDKFEDFKKCSDYLKRIDIPGKVIRIDATDFGYQRSEEVLAVIDAFMKNTSKV